MKYYLDESTNYGTAFGPAKTGDIKFVVSEPGVEILRLDEHGFHYKGETVDDAGEAHRLFTSWLRKMEM